jgi:hypothetical protein
MSHNLTSNVIPGVIGLLIILVPIAWCIVADIRAHNGRPPLRLRLHPPGKLNRVSLTPAARASAEPDRKVVSAR